MRHRHRDTAYRVTDGRTRSPSGKRCDPDHRGVQAETLAFACQGEYALARGGRTTGGEIESRRRISPGRRALLRRHHPQFLRRR